jgi:hypothetical protein
MIRAKEDYKHTLSSGICLAPTVVGADQEIQLRFWTSQTAIIVYGIVVLSILMQQWWILHGVSLVLTRKVIMVASKWISFILIEYDLAKYFNALPIRRWVDCLILKYKRSMHTIREH